MADRLKQTKKLVKSYKHNASIVRVLGACIFVCLIFCAGFAVRGNADLLTSLGFSNLLVTGVSTDEKNDAASTLSGRVAEVEDLLKAEGLTDYDLDEATEALLRAYAGSTGDDFMRYYSPKGYEDYLASAGDTGFGVGLLFAENDGRVFVADVLESSQANDYGIEVGDYVVAIDGESRDDWTMPEVLAALSREEGKEVRLTVARKKDGSEETATATLIYHEETAKNITCEYDESGSSKVAILQMKQITSDSASIMKEQVEKAVNDGATAFVLDLRNTPGGYLTQAVGIASLFMDAGTVVQVKTVSGVTTKSTEGSTLTSLPLVVLVNGQTAGSAEVLAAALQETERATVVGGTTMGKATVQVMQPLSFGGALRYTAATYLTPKGRSLDGDGVTPDVIISGSDSYELSRAVETARFGG